MGIDLIVYHILISASIVYNNSHTWLVKVLALIFHNQIPNWSDNQYFFTHTMSYHSTLAISTHVRQIIN